MASARTPRPLPLERVPLPRASSLPFLRGQIEGDGDGVTTGVSAVGGQAGGDVEGGWVSAKSPGGERSGGLPLWDPRVWWWWWGGGAERPGNGRPLSLVWRGIEVEDQKRRN